MAVWSPTFLAANSTEYLVVWCYHVSLSYFTGAKEIDVIFFISSTNWYMVVCTWMYVKPSRDGEKIDVFQSIGSGSRLEPFMLVICQ